MNDTGAPGNRADGRPGADQMSLQYPVRTSRAAQSPTGTPGQSWNNVQHQNTRPWWTAEVNNNTPVRSDADCPYLGVGRGFPELSPSEARGTAGAQRGTHGENRRCARSLPSDTRDTKTDSSLCASVSGRPGLPLAQETHSLSPVMAPACTTLTHHLLCPVPVPSNRARTEGAL